MDRITTIVCPNPDCKTSIKIDTLLNKVEEVREAEYPALQPHGTAWCDNCQHGTPPTEEGFCSTCLDKGLEFRIQPAFWNKKTVTNKEAKAMLESKEVIVEETVTTDDTPTEEVKVEIKPEIKKTGKKKK